MCIHIGGLEIGAFAAPYIQGQREHGLKNMISWSLEGLKQRDREVSQKTVKKRESATGSKWPAQKDRRRRDPPLREDTRTSQGEEVGLLLDR